ncbi:MAG: Fe(2+) transporter permease subunit FeoB [Marivibrio sp.]|uniref:Fe(2+) transporter permease subunit FeoB n=1 Tax=Marivibrio sp. TaxID=2039719 RepID=UPI0032ECE1E3
MSETYVVGVVGNPNCGKTTLFNALTGAKQRVGNWPGVTVERKVGRFEVDGVAFDLVDLPGTYSLDASDDDVSLDEAIARDYVAGREADLIVNIVDASNLERNLYLTTQLLEMRVPTVVALNMVDVAAENGIELDAQALTGRLDVAVCPIVASTGQGVPDLKAAILDAARAGRAPRGGIPYPREVESAVAALTPAVEAAASEGAVDARWLAVRLLEGDSLAVSRVGPDAAGQADLQRAVVEEALGDDIDIALADARYGYVGGLLDGVMSRKRRVSRSLSDRIDRVVLNRALGIPIFLIAMHLMFMFTINIGGAFIDAFDIVAGAIAVDGLAAVLGALGAPEWSIVLLANGLGGGVQVVATFIPIVGFLFLFLSILEDSGYMARAAFVMDRFLRAIGLPGKSFVPLIVGFGCTVPAVMATRTLEHERDRYMTIAMAPFMSCGARLPVYALFAAAFFAAYGQYIVFLLYLIGLAAAVLTGLVLKHTLLRGPVTPFVMELPPYHVPTVKGVLIRTWERTRSFMIRAGRVIVPMVLVLNVLNNIGTDGSFGNEDSDKSVLSEVGRTITPLFTSFGVEEDNWPAAVGVFTGVLAKEAVVGTLDSLYGALGEEAGRPPELRHQQNIRPLTWRADKTEEELPPPPEATEEAGFDFTGTVVEGVATIPDNLVAAVESWTDPLGLNIGETEDQEQAAALQEVGVGTFGAMAERFDGAAGAFAYCLFILLYFPCAAAMAAVRRETTLRWMAFVGAWTTGLAYVASTLFYQIAVFAREPVTASIWIAIALAISAASVVAMRLYGNREARGGAGSFGAAARSA